MEKHSERVVKSSEVLGVAVKSPDKEDLGKIEEIVIDKISGEVVYVVLSFGGFLGLGDKLFALPWHSIHYSTDDDCFILNVDKEKLKNAPGFDKDRWPDMAGEQWQTAIRDYWV